MYARIISSRVSVHEKSPKTDNICDLGILVGYVSVRPSRLIFQIDNSDFNNSQLSAVYRRLQVIIGPLSLPFINSIFCDLCGPFCSHSRLIFHLHPRIKIFKESYEIWKQDLKKPLQNGETWSGRISECLEEPALVFRFFSNSTNQLLSFKRFSWRWSLGTA